MKEKETNLFYKSPTVTLILLDTQDVLTASGNPDLGEWDTEL